MADDNDYALILNESVEIRYRKHLKFFLTQKLFKECEETDLEMWQDNSSSSRPNSPGIRKTAAPPKSF